MQNVIVAKLSLAPYPSQFS